MNPARRRLLEQGLAAAALAAAGLDARAEAASVKREAASAKGKTVPRPPGAWSPRIPALPAGGTFDLATTLPPGVARGGRFGIDSSGAPLPAGMSLSESGILSAGTARTGKVVGVVFTYDTP